MERTIKAIWVICAVVVMTGCDPFFRESRRMAEAYERAQQVYGEGENDTLLFIPELDKASAYYARKKDYGKAALAALYYGYSEKDYDKTSAMDAFKEAERYGALVGDSLTMARAEYQMGKMLYEDYIYNEALDMLGKADVNFGQRYDERAFSLNMAACCHILLQEYNAADSCLNQSLVCAELGNSEEARSKALNNYAILYKLQGEYDKAIVCLKTVRLMNIQQTVLNQLNLGDVFMASGMVDSAGYYYKLMETNLSRNEVKDETKVSAYGSLSWFSEKQGDYYSALYYRKLYDNLQFKIQKRLEEKNIYHIYQKYDYNELENEVKVEKMHNQRNIMIIVVLMMFVAILVIVMVFRHKQNIREKAELEVELDKMKRDLLKSIDIVKVEECLSWRLRLLLKVKRIQEGNQSVKIKQQQLKRYIMNGEDGLYDTAVSVIDEVYPRLQSAIQLRYPDLSETELKVCMLSIKGLSNAEIADILEVSVHTVNKCRSTLYRKMGVESVAFKENITEFKSTYQTK